MKKTVLKKHFYYLKNINYLKEIVELTKKFFNINIEKRNIILLSNTEKKVFLNIKKKLSELQIWDKEGIKNILDNILKEENIKKKDIYPKLREVLIEEKEGFEIIDIIFCLNKEQTIKRINILL